MSSFRIPLAYPTQSSIVNSVFSSGLLIAPVYNAHPTTKRLGMLYLNSNNLTLYLSVAIDTWVPIGTGGGPLPPPLQSIAGLTTAADQTLYTTASNEYAVTSLNPWARANLFTASSAPMLNTLLGTVSAITLSTANALIKVAGTNTISESGILVTNSNNVTGINDITIGGNLAVTGIMGGLTAFERTQLQNIDTTAISITQWGFVGNADQNVKTTSIPSFAGMNMTGNLSMGNNKITLSGAPTEASDVANKAYVDNVASGTGLRPLVAAQVATSVALATSSYSSVAGTITETDATATLTVDAVAITVNDGKRILVKNQVTNSENGIYTRTANAAGNHWVLTRTSDFNSSTPPPILKDTFIFIEGGTANTNSAWLLSRDVTQFNPVIDSSSVIWVQFSGSIVLLPNDGLIADGTNWSVDATARFTFTGVAPNRQLELVTVTTPFGGTGLVLSAGDTNKVLVTNGADGTNPLNIDKVVPTGDFVGTTDSQTLTNKILTDNTNNVIARGLFSSTGANTVSVYSAANPTAGQVLTATGASAATWQNPTGGDPSIGYNIINVSSSPFTVLNSHYFITVDTTSIPITLNLPQISALGKKIYNIIDGGGKSSIRNIIINTFAGDTINGQSSLTMDTDHSAVSIVNDNVTKWYVF